ncbi:unnamed protein product [Miscanthus lutarioriparius]|uniref:DUF4408 domain-containing protein n=1 Tax=Miscanthus lutarioriparius TaxID=422564 RepID=A0A811RNE4_9POAL|nr:unnamed protein product [Miscanthus lutarioriparius]
MDSADAATPLGAWAWIRGYFSPATLFLVVNLVIGTIALTSRATQQRRRREHYYHDDAHGHHLQEEPLHPQMEQPGYGHYYHPEQTLYAPPPAPAPLARTSSVLDRLRSLGLYRFRSGDFPPEYGAAAAAAAPNYAQDVSAPVEEEETTATAHYARSRSEPAPAAGREDERRPSPAPPRVKKSGSEVRKSQVARAVPRVVEAVAENDDSVEEARAQEPVGGFRRGPSPLQQEYNYQEEYVPPPARVRAPAAPTPLQRTSSVLDRLRSLGLYGFLAPDQPAAASVPASDGFATPADEKRHAHYDRSRSEPAPEQGKKEKKSEAKSRMAKSSSEARKTPAQSPVEAGGECVDARAEAFIDSFRQQQQQVVHHYQEEEYVPPPVPAPPLSRTSSVLDRLRSFGLYRFRSGDLGPDLPAAAETDEKEKQEAAHHGRSRSEPAREQGKKKQEARMSKSSSSGVVEEAETEQCVDARADDFINKFRQQLQLQRLNSLLNYKEMLNGGGGGGGKQ